MKANKEQVNKDLAKRMKKQAREDWGFEPTKVEKSKKAYNRQKSKRIDLDNDQ